jgi:hypothetical protein
VLFERPSRIVLCKISVGQEQNIHGITDKHEMLMLKQDWIVLLAMMIFFQNLKTLKFGMLLRRNLFTAS